MREFLAAAAGALLLLPQTAAQAAPQMMAKLSVMNNHGLYSVWLTVGTPPQLQECVVDMSTSDSFFVSKDLGMCQNPLTPNYKCNFVFDTALSSSLYLYPPTFPSFVSSASNFSGSFAADDVHLGVHVEEQTGTTSGGFSLWNATFGLAQAGNGTPACVLGLGPPNGESSVTTMENGIVSPVYDNLPILMKKQGFVNRASYSVYLNDWDAPDGFVLFGGVDHAKFKGNLSIVPLIDYAVDASLGTKLVGSPTDFQVVLNGISVLNENVTVPIAESQMAVSLSFGNTFTALPASIVKPLAQVLGLYAYNDMFYFPCNREATIRFNLSGVEINVPLSQYSYTLNETMDNGEDACLLLMYIQDDPLWLLGDPFVRSTYVYIDLEQFQAAIAPVNYTTDADVEIVNADGAISRTSLAPLYNGNKLSSNITLFPPNTTFFPKVSVSGAASLYVPVWALVAALLLWL